MNKEHFWPRWLIRMTQTSNSAVRWGDKRVGPNSTKIPLCSRCNTDFGRHLEEPARLAFLDLEGDRGLSDLQAEILVRWLWKFVGLAFRMQHPLGPYTQRYTVRDRVLRPIDEVREHISLAVSLIDRIEPGYGDAPMGLDTPNGRSAICVAGVFSRIAIAVVERDLESMIDTSRFDFYRFAKPDHATHQAKLFFPRVGFSTCTDAVAYMASIGGALVEVHDQRMTARHQ